jgi:hypothetical protein
MKELTNKKTGVAYLTSDEEYEEIKSAGILKRFTVNAVEPIKKLIPTPKLITPKVEIKKTKAVKND